MYGTYLKLLDKLGQLRLETLDPSALVNIAKDLPLMVGVALVVAGLVSTLVGGQRYVFRLILTPIAVMAGYTLAPQLAQMVHLSPKLASYAGAGLLGLGAVIWPPTVLFLAFGALGGSVGGELAGEKDFWVGFIPGFILGGTLALVVSRIVAVLVSAAMGGVMFVLGLLTLLSFTRLAGLVFSVPTLSLGLAGCIAVTGMAFQFKFAPADDDEARAKKKANKLKDKELAVEAKARDKRFKQYGKKVDAATKRAKEEAKD
ncbi:MAG TPA: hypothetical protein VGK67_30315 [Myxococcales bacterium]|jgi:hypothetical protein